MGMVRPLPRMTPARRGNTVNCFATNSALKKLMPVRLPPGRASRVTRPRRRGSSGTMQTTGTVVVATGFRAVVAGYEKASGNKVDLTLVPFAPLMQKIVGALTIGDVPDVMNHDTAFNTVIPQNAWNDKLVDLTDVVETQKSQYHPTALL